MVWVLTTLKVFYWDFFFCLDDGEKFKVYYLEDVIRINSVC